MIRKPKSGSNLPQRSGMWQRCVNVETLKQIHASIIVHGFNSNPFALRELIYSSAVAISGTMNYAHRLFEQITQPDIFMWNTMIRGSAQSPNPSNAISLYTRMGRSSVLPDNFTFPFLLKACTRLSWVKMGGEVHGKVVKYGFESNNFVRNTLIYFHANCGDLNVARMLFDGSEKRDVVPWSALTAGYARRGNLDMARRLFDEMPVKDQVSWNVMITGYAKRGEMDSARKLFEEVPERDVVTWNAMIAGYVLCGSPKKAFEVFEEMRHVGERPDEVTMLSLLSASTDSEDLEVGQKIHCSLIEMYSRNLSVLLGNALIDMYAKCGSIECAQEVFMDMGEKDVSTWNAIIGGFAFHGRASEAINLFTKMLEQKIKPNEITFVGVLVACSHAGMVMKGQQYFDLMRNLYAIEPNIKHYGCMVDLLGRAGLLDEAFEFVEAMEVKPNPIIWRTLLGACKTQGNVELGELANKRLLELRRDESGDYVLLSNIYALKGEWNNVEEVRKLMDDQGVRKEPGCSMIDADKKELIHFLFDSTSKLKPKDIR